MSKFFNGFHILFLIGFYILFSQHVDYWIFCILNGHLAYAPRWYKAFWGICNSPYENMFNLIFVTSVVFILYWKKSKNLMSTIMFTIILAIWYEIGFQLMRLLENSPELARSSPSLRYPLIVNLSKFHHTAKVFAITSFQSGHALINGIFYTVCHDMLSHRRALLRIFCLSILLCLPRMIAGAHAFSDIIVGYTLGYYWYKALSTIIQFFLRTKEALFTANVLEEDFLRSQDVRRWIRK